MLVLSRKEKESIIISENIKITVTKIKGNRVKVCVEAPEAVRIVRAELEKEKAE